MFLNDERYYRVLRSTDDLTYIFVTNSFLSNLFSNLSLSFPELDPADFSAVLTPNDLVDIPSDLNQSDVLAIGTCVHSSVPHRFSVDTTGKFPDDGIANSFFSMPVDLGKCPSRGSVQV